MRGLLLVFGLLVGCGRVLAPGTYKVDVRYLEDTWPASKAPHTSKGVIYHITESDGMYQLSIYDTPFRYTGMEQGGSVVFYRLQPQEDPSCFYSSLSLRLRQEGETSISGEGTTETIMDCKGTTFITKVTIAGYMVEEL